MTIIPVPSIYERKRIPKKAIDEIVRQIVEKFQPQKMFRARQHPVYDAVCFHAQQCAEKYLMRIS